MEINPSSWKFGWLEGCLQLKEGFVNIIVIVIQKFRKISECDKAGLYSVQVFGLGSVLKPGKAKDD